MPTRGAKARWEGGLKGGTGTFSTATGLSADYSFSSRFESGEGSNPEEMLAAAEAACYSMALSAGLERAGNPPTSVDTTAQCTIEKVGEGFKVTKMRLEVRASVPKIDAGEFRKLAEATKDSCPISQVMKGNVSIELDAKLV